MATTIHDLIAQWRRLGPSGWATNPFGWIAEDHKPIRLAAWQKAVLDAYQQRREDVETLFISTVKKAGKTTTNSILTAHRWLTVPGLHYAVGNDADQSAELQITMVAAMVRRHPILRQHVKITRSELTFEPTGSRLVSLPMDFRGSAGSNHVTASFTELWAFGQESAIRLFEELTPPPLTGAVRVIDSYAGYEGESTLLRQIWDRGLQGERVSTDWPIYMTGRQLSFIATGEDAQRRCWRGTEAQRLAYYAEQKATLRPLTYLRLHENQWISAESTFIEPEMWDNLVLKDYRCPLADDLIDLTIGVDLAVRHDHAAVVTVWREDNGPLHLGPYKIWQPSGGEAIDLGEIEKYIVQLDRDYKVIRVVYDPWQAAYLSQRLEQRGLPLKEYPQTVANMTEAGNGLFDAIRQGNLIVYPGAVDLREHVLNASAKETGRGIRLVKEAATRKIDAAVALAMAVVAAKRKVYGPPGVHRYA